MLKTESPTADWARFEPRSEALYIHLHGKGNRLLRIAGGRAVPVLNGTEIQLEPNARMQAIEFDESVTPAAAVAELRELVADALPVHPDHRWTVLSWLLTAFFLDSWHTFGRQKAILCFSGEGKSGKTAAGRLLSVLLYGADHLEAAPSDYLLQAGSEHPLLILEPPVGNGGRVPFQRIFHSLTEGSRLDWIENRRTLSMDPRSLVALTVSDGAFDVIELASRSYQVECSQEHHRCGFDLTNQLREVSRRRSRILSGIFNLFATDVVPDLVRRHLAALEDISKAHPGHSKNRMDTFLALMVPILRALLGSGYEARRLVDAWIKSQG